LLGSLLTGCVRHAPPADLVIINGAEPESLDPAIITGQPDLRVVGTLFEGLTRYHPRTAEPEPGSAERWEISSDRLVYTFHLRANARWSTGEPITADDVVFSWLRVLNPVSAAEYASQLFCLKNAEAYNAGKLTDPSLVGVKALDARTVRVELHSPIPFFLSLCAHPTLAIVPRQAIEQHGDRWLAARPLPTSGAFELVSWRLNDKIRLRKNPHYWDAANTGSEIVDVLPITSPSTALNLYETRAADVIWDKTLLPNELLDLLLARGDFRRFDYIGSYFIRFNVTRPPFDDVRVRRALALALDRSRIVGKLLKGGERPTTHHTPVGVANYTPPEGLPHDAEAARRFLAEAGFAGGQGFPNFTYLFNSVAGGGAKPDGKIAVEIQEMWKRELGLRAELRQMEWKVYLATQRQLGYDTCRSSWIGDYNDANTFLDMFMSQSGNNRTGWKSPRYDALIRQANHQADPHRRAELLRQAETILIRDEVVIIPLYAYAGIMAFRPDEIEGLYGNILDEHPIRAIRPRKERSAVRRQ
jgi:oligopeptide transport system substrate-binding protein